MVTISPETIWITGARGFIGRHLSRELSTPENHVCGLGHGIWPEQQAADWGLRHWINGDVVPGNLELLERISGAPDYVFHLAGGASVGAAVANPREDFFRTVATTMELLEWLRLRAPACRLIVVSSAAVYGAGHSDAISEARVANPFSPYGHHKFVMEQLCRSYATSYGTRVLVARLFSVYGQFLQKQLLWDLCTKLNSGADTLELGGSGNELRDWIDVRDVVRALASVRDLASDAMPILNVGTGISTSVREVAALVCDAWPSSVAVKFNGNARVGDPFSLLADWSCLRSHGFEWQIPVETGVRDYVEWYRLQSGAKS